MNKTHTFHPLLFTLSTLLFMSCMLSIPAKASAEPNTSLADTYWELTELNGLPASPGADKKELHMTLTSEGSKVSGFSGCNRFMGGYKQEGSQIQFGPLAGTMMACMEGMEQEQTFLRTLQNSSRFSLPGGELALYNANGQLVLLFESVQPQ